jgi:hypothetical protein
MAIFNITQLELYADPSSDNVMVFTLVMLLELMVTMGLELELYYRALGDKICIQNHTLDEMRFRSGPSFMAYLAAFILASVQYVQASLAESPHNGNGERATWDLHDLPMTLTAAVYFLRLVLSTVRFFWRNKKGDIREWYVPNNVDYLIHRYGEFIMLMMGEGILSLLTGKLRCAFLFMSFPICLRLMNNM